MSGIDALDRHELGDQYQKLFEQTARIERDAREASLDPAQLDSNYRHLCCELEQVTLKMLRFNG